MLANKPIGRGLRMSSPSGNHDTGGTGIGRPDNQLLAGYLAHEFITKGTLFGHRFQMTGADERRPAKKSRLEGQGDHVPAREKENAEDEKQKVYVEVARLLREEGMHLPGIVNPSQLAVHLQIV